MNSIIFGVIFWVLLLGTVWLVRPGSGLLRITMERWTAAHTLVTVLVLAALIGSSAVPHVERGDHRETDGRDRGQG